MPIPAARSAGLTAAPRRADFGSKPSPRRRAELQKLHPAGLTDDWADKLAGSAFYSHNQKATFEHYLQARPPYPSLPYPTLYSVPQALPPEDHGRPRLSTACSEAGRPRRRGLRQMGGPPERRPCGPGGPPLRWPSRALSKPGALQSSP